MQFLNRNSKIDVQKKKIVKYRSTQRQYDVCTCKISTLNAVYVLVGVRVLSICSCQRLDLMRAYRRHPSSHIDAHSHSLSSESKLEQIVSLWHFGARNTMPLRGTIDCFNFNCMISVFVLSRKKICDFVIEVQQIQ